MRIVQLVLIIKLKCLLRKEFISLLLDLEFEVTLEFRFKTFKHDSFVIIDQAGV